MDSAPKKSAAVPLVLMGAVVGVIALPVVFGGTDVQRNHYLRREDCIADYSEAQCSLGYPIGQVQPGSSPSYYGPWYRSDPASRAKDPSDPGNGRFYSSGGRLYSDSGTGFDSASRAAPAGVEAGSRGGFGSHGVSARGG